MAPAEEVLERLNPSHPYPLISHGLPYNLAIAKHLSSSLSSSKPFILISASLSRNTDALSKGMQPHTLYSEVLSLASQVRSSAADSIVVVGGGSLVDGAKAVVFALANGADTHDKLDELFKTSNLIRHRQKIDPPKSAVPEQQKPATIPLMCATTTLSAGEFSPFGAATDERTKHKQLFAEPGRQAAVIVMDPTLTLTAPGRVWLSTGLRAVDHCVESICNSAPNEAGTAAALRGLERLIPALLRTREDGGDLGARLDAQLGAMESMRPFVVYGVPVGASHGIGHQIGPYGVPHAETTCIALPAVQKFNAKVNAVRQAIVLDALWGNDEVTAVLGKYGLVRDKADLGDAVDVIIRELGFPRTLKEYGIGRDRLGNIAESSLKDALCQKNVIPLTEKEQVLEILEMCLGED
ncbi:Dehydroquinate synthase-like protein [Coniochaeta ligniaria NRRL 30616]|uniref:Dehydroquinate synthase-like protein n=1 Tax=Coniochaeta ligniaria NRRL 30616 TaxID=1408157 RepID=A0A1J7J9F9_9PEZI|nr:Dehydroquinate synthase-like protein [Coniochaeta ligniaria NRRL 30616]